MVCVAWQVDSEAHNTHCKILVVFIMVTDRTKHSVILLVNAKKRLSKWKKKINLNNQTQILEVC